jgi:3-hydroxyacyl-CoA dehydrogenase/enoyl-CoA hydratase/3-hydroxybutyryl-CoA epimerase
MINTFFFNLNAIKSGQSRPRQRAALQACQGRAAGCGHDGCRHCLLASQQGHATVLKDVSQEKADLGKSYSAKITQGRVDKGRMKPEAQAEILARIQPTAGGRPAGCDLIIEAVFENRELKARVTKSPSPCWRWRLLCLQHLHTADQRPGHGQPRTRKVHRHPLLQPGGQDEAGGDHSRQANRR